MTANQHEEVELTEAMQVWWNRYYEARTNGLTVSEARLYATSDIDCGELRHLIALGCSPDLLAAILL